MNKKIPYSISNSYVLRTPLFPINYIYKILDDNFNETEFLKIFDDSTLRESIYLASPALYKRLLDWKNNSISDSKELELLCISFFKYLSRISTRCTPFGLFAGCTVGYFGDETKICISNLTKLRRHTRLDMNYLCSLVQDLIKIPEIKNSVLFYPNSSIFISNNQIRYVEYKYINGTRNYFVMGVANSPYLQKVIQKAQKGELINNLIEVLVDKDVCLDEATDFINELIDSQLLVSQLEPSISGDEFTNQLLDVLKNISIKPDIYKSIKSIDFLLKKIDDSDIGSSISIYEEIKKIISEFNTEFDENYLFQTDLFLETENNLLNTNIKNELLSGIEILNRLTSKYVNISLEDFKSSFYRRYEEEEIPLYEALDPEIGIGYGNKSNFNSSINPLIDDLNFPDQDSTSSNNSSYFQDLLFKKYLEAISNHKLEIQIYDEELKDLKVDWDDLPITFSTMVEIYTPEGTNDIHIKMDKAGDSSAANLIGRFCHGDNKIYQVTKEITDYEKLFNKEIVQAEILHLPESRTGNILLRPKLRDFEIPYLTRSTLISEFQLDINDLLVSVPNGNYIQLRSKKLNKIIMPRLSTAHNYKLNPLPIYEFLCDLQSQNLRIGLNFNWGGLYAKASFFPRVKYKNIYLSLANWNIDKDDFKDFIDLDNNDLIEKFTDWRKQKDIPKYVRYIQGDNMLFLNLNNILCIKTLFSLIKNQKTFRIEEFLFNHDNSIVKSENGYHSNQFVFHFFKTSFNA